MSATVVEHLSNLIRIPSVSFLSNRPVIDYATGVLHAAQWQTRELSYTDPKGIEKTNLIAAPPGQDLDNPAAELAFMIWFCTLLNMAILCCDAKARVSSR